MKENDTTIVGFLWKKEILVMMRCEEPVREKMFEVNHRTNDVKCEQNTLRSERSRSARYHLPILTGVTCFMGIFSGQGML